MIYHSIRGRVLGLVVCCVVLSSVGGGLLADEYPASSKYAEVAATFKAAGLTDFDLADYEDELVECSALAAVHTLIGDNIGEDEGTEVRKTLDKDYWIEASHDYLSLAQEASGEADLHKEFGIQVRGIFAEWRRLNDTVVSANSWAGWYDLTDRCDAWRPAKPTHAYYSKGRKSVADPGQATKVTMASE